MKTAMAILAALAVSGCALTSKSEALDIHYFTPANSANVQTNPNAVNASELRLGRVAAGDNLHERIAFSDGGHEVGYYDDRRWTERPDFYVRRALTRALFEKRGLKHVVAGEAPTFDVDVISFEEIKTKTKHAVRIELAIQLSDDHAVLFEARRTVEKPVGDDKTFETVVAAMSEALDDATNQVADSVATALRSRPEAPAPARSSSR